MGRRRSRNEWRGRLDRLGRRTSPLRTRLKENWRQIRECLRQIDEDQKFIDQSLRDTAVLLQQLRKSAAVIRANGVGIDEAR